MTTPSQPAASGSAAPLANRSRREFLKHLTVLPAGVMAARAGAVPAAPAPADPAARPPASPMPTVPFGKYAMSRLIVGANPFNAGSHLSVFVNHEMRAYYTPEQILKTLRRCQEEGINFWQGSGGNHKLYQRFLEEGGRMHYLCIHSAPAEIPMLVAAGCAGIAHHGEATDRLFKTGQLDKVQSYLKQVRDAGLMVGVSTHMPEVVDAIESKGWDLDFYMTCVYERHRSAAELEKLLGQAPIPLNEVYLPQDPPRMFKAMRQTAKPCLAFKILAAGRLSERREWVENAFRQTFQSIKPNDAVIVGIYDRYTDQVADGAELTRRFGRTDPRPAAAS